MPDFIWPLASAIIISIPAGFFIIIIPLLFTIAIELLYCRLFRYQVRKRIIVYLNMITNPIINCIIITAAYISSHIETEKCLSSLPIGDPEQFSSSSLSYKPSCLGSIRFPDLSFASFSLQNWIPVLLFEIVIIYTEYYFLIKAYPKQRKEMLRLSIGMNIASFLVGIQLQDILFS